MGEVEKSIIIKLIFINGGTLNFSLLLSKVGKD